MIQIITTLMPQIALANCEDMTAFLLSTIQPN